MGYAAVVGAGKKAAGERKDWTTSSFGERVDHVCTLRNLSLNQLGAAANIESGPMSRHHNRVETLAPNIETAMRIAKAGKVKALWMLLGQGAVEETNEGVLRSYPNWAHELAEAKKRQRGIPEEFWNLVGELTVPLPTIDWQLIVGLVRTIYSAYQRTMGASSA